MGTKNEVENFIYTSLILLKAAITKNGFYSINLSESPRQIKEIFNNKDKVKVKFDKPVKENMAFLHQAVLLFKTLLHILWKDKFDPDFP